MNRALACWLLAALVAGAAALALQRADDAPASVDEVPRRLEASAAPAGPNRTASSPRSARDRSEKPDERPTRRRRGADGADHRPTAAGESTAGTNGAATTTAAAPRSWEQAPDADAGSCPATPRGIVVDRAWQRAWLCADGSVIDVIPITSASNQPDPGSYPIYAMDFQSQSSFGDAPSTLDRFVAFTYGKFQGARIGFHAVPYYADGTFAQPFDSVGDLARLGESSGCIRVLPDHAELIYGYLQIGDEVRVIS